MMVRLEMRARRAVGMWAVLAALVVWALGAGCASSGSSMLKLSKAELEQKLSDDLRQIKRYDRGLKSAMSYAEVHPELFPKDQETANAMAPEERRALGMLWRQVLDYMIALDGIKSFWEAYQALSFWERPVAHSQAFLTGYAAWVTQYYWGLEWMERTVPSEPLEVMLDEPLEDAGVPGGMFRALKLEIIHVKALWQLVAGREYLRILTPKLREESEEAEVDFARVVDTLVPYIRESRVKVNARGLTEYSYNAFDIARDASFGAWFPVQKGVAEWMGDTKVARLHRHLIQPAQIDTMQASMEPGDVVVARHNWYLSNIGLPGFWPHAELYVGSPDELEAFFDSPDVKAWLETLPGQPATFGAFLEASFPEAWASYTSPASDKQPRRVLEAISEGVVFRSLRQSAGADYVAVMRPRLSRVDQAKTLAKAFAYYGRPYDFNFDFLTDSTLVCSEVVYKAFLPDTDKGGVTFPLETVVGRSTLPPNTMVRYFDKTYDPNDPARPLDFVYFLDGQESSKSAVVRDVDVFRKSWRRPKWDIAQK